MDILRRQIDYKINQSPFPALIQNSNPISFPMSTNTKVISAGGATTKEEIPSDILIEALRHLEGQSLASASCAASHPDLWRRLCLSTWPSLHHPRLLPLLNSAPHRFFSDAFPFPAEGAPADDTHLPDKLFSAVDLYCRGIPIFSCAVETDTSTPWFRSSPFMIDAPSAAAVVSPEDLTLSWIVIDPAKGRAVNLSSRRAVAVGRRQWCSGETVARFATVRDGWAVGAVVTWAWRKGKGDVLEVGLTMENMDGVCVSGLEGLRVVEAAMEAERKGNGEEMAKEMYLEYLETKRNREERREKRAWLGDMLFAGVAVAVFFSFIFLSVFR